MDRDYSIANAAGTVLAGSTGISIVVQGATLVQTNGYYSGRCLLINPAPLARMLGSATGGYQTDPAGTHTVSGSGTSAVHLFTFSAAQPVPTPGDVAIVGGF